MSNNNQKLFKMIGDPYGSKYVIASDATEAVEKINDYLIRLAYHQGEISHPKEILFITETSDITGYPKQ